MQNVCISVLNALNELHLKLYIHDDILFNNNDNIVFNRFWMY